MARSQHALDGKPWLAIPKQTWKEFREDHAPLHAAALAFFTLFAVLPMMLLALLTASRFFGDQSSETGQLFEGADTILGEEQASALQNMLVNAQPPGGSLVATLVGIAVLLYAASRLFTYLEISMNRIWDVKPRPGRSLLHALKTRLVSFALVLIAIVLLIGALLLSSVFAGLTEYAAEALPYAPVTLQIIRAVLTITVFTGVFMVLFKTVPDARIRWGDVAVGAFVTAVLVALGQFAIGMVLSGSTLADAYGALSTVVVALLWFYYTSMIFLFGAEFTQVYARRHGEPIEPLPELSVRRGRKDDPPARRRSHRAT